ncbi:MAG: alpha/beta hydrolase, partial [Gammaproteobacteria bacterium]
ASRSGFPGVVQEDALDLYYAMRLVMDFVKKQRRARVGRIGMLGLSDGARYTAFMSPIDAARKQIGIETYLLINPPVDLLKAANKIDSMAELGNHLGQKQREVLEAYAFGTVDNALQNDPAAREYFEDWNVRFHLTDHQIAYLIGNELQKNVGDAIYTSSLSCDRGALKTPISWGYRTERLEEARSYTIIGYLKKFLIPGIKRSSGKDISVKELNEQTSLKAIPSILANQKNIFLMHNLDDFLISKEGFAYLERVFGDRAIFYPYGGHLGNLWYTENQKDMLRLLNPLFSHYDRRAPRGF